MASETGNADEVSKPLPGGSFEGCVRRFGQDPGIEDPEAFCGWLEQQAKEGNEAVLSWDAEEDSVEDLIEALNDPQAQKVLQNLTVTYVSGVENPAQDSQWVMAKDAGDRGADWGVTAPLVVKQGNLPMTEDGEEEQKAWAPVLIPNETDKQGDVIPTKEIETAAHDFLAEYRQVDTDHDLLAGKGVPIESWTLKTDTTFDLPDGSESREYPAGTWFMGVKFNDEAWDRIKSGELTGFSIYGEAENTPVGEILGLSASAKEVDRSTTSNAGAVALAKSVHETASNTKTIMSDDNPDEDGETEGANEALEAIKSTVEENNTLAKEAKEDLTDLRKSHESLEDRVDSLEEDLEAVKSAESAEAEGEESEAGTSEEPEGDAGTETNEAPEDGVTEEDLEEAKEALREDLQNETEEAASKAAEAAVKSVLGLDEDEDLPEDPAERRDVIRKGLVEAGEDGNQTQTIGFTAEDIEGAIQ